jgi:hypothetical protein
VGHDVTFDCEREAAAAMKMAAAASGAERTKWVRAALAWHDLGRGRIAEEGNANTQQLASRRRDSVEA